MAGAQSVLCWATTSIFSYMKGGAILGTCGLNCCFMPTLGKGPSWNQNALQDSRSCCPAQLTGSVRRDALEPSSSGRGSYSRNDQSGLGNKEPTVKAKRLSPINKGVVPNPRLPFTASIGHALCRGQPFHSVSQGNSKVFLLFLRARKS